MPGHRRSVVAPGLGSAASRRLAMVCLALAGAVLIAALLEVIVSGAMGLAFDDLAELAVAFLAAVNCALAARATRGRLRASWAALSIACLSWAVGEAIWSTFELLLHRDTPFPSVADVGFLGFPVGAVVALALFPAHASRADRRRMTLDGLMVATSIGLVSWATALGAVFEAGGDSLLGMSVSLAYPVSDIALLVMCVLVLSRSRAHRLPLGLVAAGLALMAVADSGFAYLNARGDYGTGGLVDGGWLLAFALLSLAPMTRSATAADAETGEIAVAGALLPYVPLGVAAAFSAWQYSQGERLSDVEAVLIGVLVALVLLRQFLTVRDNQQLARVLSRREAQLHYQAFHDPLTGLANRALYIDRLAHAIELHRRDRRALAVCFLDLDGFKAVNDTHGHATGDDLLKQVAGRFHGELSEADTLARLGGDEFAVLLEGHENPLDVAHALLSSVLVPVWVAGQELSVSASIGVAQIGEDDETPTVDELLSRADDAMYVVKRRGKSAVLLHTPGLAFESGTELEIEQALARDVRRGAIGVVFQPIVDLAEGRVDTFETLARWTYQERMVPPELFVRLAEQCDVIGELFRFVLAEACRELARWRALPGGEDLRVAVNVSPCQLVSGDLVGDVEAELARQGLAGDRLVLEITENGDVVDVAASQRVCQALRSLGVRLSIDDLGAGMSSLARLRDLPIDEVKIDRSFVSGLDSDPARQRFVRGVLAFAGEVGLVVVAEGVETARERETLLELGCTRAQGFLFSRPASGERLDPLIGAGWAGAVPGQRRPERAVLGLPPVRK